MVGTQGAVPSPTRYLLGVQALCRKYGCLLILDEVMGGFGRTGKWFAYQHHDGLEPDIVTIAKGLTNAYVPLGGVCVSKKVGDFFNKTPVPMGSTYNSHPVGLAAAWAALQLYEKNKVLEHVADVAPVLAAQLAALQAAHPARVQAVRSIGLHGALEIRVPAPTDDADKHNACVAAANKVLRARGMCTFCKYHRHMKALYIMCNPPLCITEAQLKDAFAILKEVVTSIDAVLA